MEIDLHPISGNVGKKLSFRFQDEELSERLRSESPWLKSISSVSGIVKNQGERFSLEGEISYEIFCKCDRCLKEVSRIETMPFYEEVSEEEQEQDNLRIQGENVDLSSLVEDYLLLSEPAQRLCEEECKGLCLNCGCDLNQTNCECKADEYNPKFGKLAFLKDRLS